MAVNILFSRQVSSMIAVARFCKVEDADLARGRLEANGVAAFLADELTVRINWLWSNAIGGVRIVVADEDYERAKELLEPEPADSDQNEKHGTRSISSHPKTFRSIE